LHGREPGPDSGLTGGDYNEKINSSVFLRHEIKIRGSEKMQTTKQKPDASVADEGAAADDVLLIRLRLLGDIIFTIPAVQILKEHRPQSRVHYVVESRFSEIASIIPGVDNVITVPAKPGWRDVRDFRRMIKGLNVQTVIDFHSGPTSALLTRVSGAARRVGYRTLNRNWAYTDMVPRSVGALPVHSVINQARLLEKIGIPGVAVPAYPALDLSRLALSERLRPVTGLCPGVVIHVGAGNRFRDWGLENFTALIRALSASQVPIFLIGRSLDEQARARELSLIPHTHDLSGPLAIGDLLHLISKAAAYIGADSGPLHLASLTATPLVALFGPNLPEVSGPWRKESVRIMQLAMPCRPCSQRRCKYDTIPCMRRIAVEEVYDAVIPFIA
jgi:ADP-heptose:LPS heptosyltransferase